ncbi:MAG: sulfotransferase, partial [Acidobacteriota bacterium]
AAPQLLEIFPDSFFVHVLRDGRDVLASHRDVEKRLAASGQDSYHHANFNRRRICGRWNRAVSIHRELRADRELDGRVIEVRFEDLLIEPAKVLEQLFASLSLELEAATLNPEKLPARHGGIAPDGYWTTEEQLRQPFDPDKIQRWQHSLPLTDRVLANLFMAGPLQRLGYPVSPFYVHAHRTLAVLRKRQPSN